MLAEPHKVGHAAAYSTGEFAIESIRRTAETADPR
jgi:hypothetical protein